KLTAVFLLFFSATLFSQKPADGYEIKIKLKPFKNQYVYLGHYYGKQLPILDSVKLNEQSQGVFKGTKKLGGGIYLIGFPDRANRFEFLVGKEQHFSIAADTTSLRNISFTGSAENTSFKAYQDFMTVNGKALDELLKKRTGSAPADSLRINMHIDTVSKKVAAYRQQLMAKEADGLLTALLKAMREPEVPNNPDAMKKDSLYAYKYYKAHYWDGVNFWDDRLARTPFFEGRVDKYYEQLVFPSPDSVIKEIDWMLGYAGASEEMQKFLLLKFVNRYLNMKYMWEDAVFVHLFEKYFSQKTYPWLTDKGKKMITDRAYSLMANIMGSPASEIELPDSTGKSQTLYGIASPYTLVVIYDPTCGHCKETLPRIDSFYKARWKADGVKVFAMAKQTEGVKKDDWHNFLRQFGLKGWTHVWYAKEAEQARVSANIPSYAQLYDVQSFPTLYLLDKDKRIVAKKVTEKQVDEILAQRVKTAKAGK
ncbi:MAG TPA: thioredoxin-like domain-containing protein, partial [Flavisolibacter sp.]|nr:thioredoxin-like domain-containing protein [Flavisolibacter sp.]